MGALHAAATALAPCLALCGAPATAQQGSLERARDLAARPDVFASAATTRRRGAVILLHGGAWYFTGAYLAQALSESHAARFNRAGFDTWSITYRPGEDSIGDVLRFHDALRRRIGRREPLCAFGESAGGHLALLLAARRPALRCVVSHAAPTDLRRVTGFSRVVVAHDFAPFFSLRSVSPVTHGRRLAGRVLAAHALDDPAVPHSHLTRLDRATPRLRAVTLPAGSRTWVHSGVDSRALRRLHRLEARFVRAAARQRRPSSTSTTSWSSASL